MTISFLFGCCQIETSVQDVSAVREFMIDVLGAQPIEQKLARQIAALMGDQGYDVDHLDCGSAVFQVNQPAKGMLFNGQKSIHESYLDRLGPCISNLNFFVDDIVHARKVLSGLGAPTHIEGPSNIADALGDYGPDNTRPGAGERPFLFMGTRSKFGFDLEIMEPNFLHFTSQTVQYPAFITPRPTASNPPLRLQRLVVVVESLAETHEALCAAIAPASRSKPYDLLRGELAQSFRIGLGGMEILYCQPTADTGPIRVHLNDLGPGVLGVVFDATDRESVISRWQGRSGRDPERTFDPLGLESAAPGIRLPCRELIGFDVIIEQQGPALD